MSTETQHHAETGAEVAHAGPSTALAITADQREFTRAQRATLAHMGVEDATPEDLAVFLHQVQRTGLDPFSRQIHMIGRRSKKWDPRTRQESWETKWTIQTGIDGYRLIGRRAADARGESISVQAPEWMHASGEWRPAWSKAWGMPLAARVTIVRAGQTFTAVALMDEYVQTKGDGKPTRMWADRPAGMLAKCAEALAWRQAFPLDLSGIYTNEEMAQADNAHDAPAPPAEVAQAPEHTARRRFVEAATAAGRAEPVDAETGEIVEEAPDTITAEEWGTIRPLLADMGYAEAQAQAKFAATYLGRPLKAPTEITREEFAALMREVRGKGGPSAPDPADPSRPPADYDAHPGA